MYGTIFDIKRFAVHDGPGIRTTVFLKGCPLKCAWCHNPESRGPGVETLSGRDGPVVVGRRVSAADVIGTIERDSAFFDESGGGVTFSGGEPLMQDAFLVELLDRSGELGLHRAVDTSGFAPAEVLLRVAQRADLFLFDVKLARDEDHLAHTGVERRVIRDNLALLCETGVAVELRFPLIPGVTDTAPNLSAMGEWLGSLPRRLPLRVLPYHRASRDKYPRFGLTPRLPDVAEPTKEHLERCRSMLDGVAASC